MARPRQRLIGWTYDDQRQEIHTPSSVIPLIVIAQRIQDDVQCRYDFSGAWSGWRMRGDQLYPPGHKRGNGCIKPTSWPLFRAYLDEVTRRELAAVGLPATPQGLRLVFSR